ncbi:MAG: AmmeMemoRadiSam system protein B [Elusimicrobia bacterium]|nr:AmmeMemoRadiSam system protein B [Elusimicrobiota bacterium]
MKGLLLALLLPVTAAAAPSGSGERLPSRDRGPLPADRAPAVAGQFYPADPAELSRAVDTYLSQAKAPDRLPGPLMALVVPHAGYEYSAPVAAFGYKAVSGPYDTVVVIGAGHRSRVEAAGLYARGAFLTPLGRVPVDEALAARLMKGSPDLFQDRPDAHQGEHSIEVQLPFLIRRLKAGWKLLPVVMNTDDPRVCARAGEALAAALKGRKALIVASSDLSHYPPAATAEKVDRATLKALERLDPEFFWLANRVMMDRGERGLDTTWCGESAVLAAMAAAKALGADRAVLLRYAHSGSAPAGDDRRVVGYAAAAMVRSGKPASAEPLLDEAQKKSLLALARRTVAEGAEGRRPEARLSDDPALNLPAAVFVTLKERGQLRGCIGTTEPRATLRDAVASAAWSAAFQDHRFPPVAKGEVDGLHLEVSMLSPARPVPDAGKVIPGKHGVILSQDGRSGLFLPQVWEQIPDKDGFLSELCAQKAGLPRSCWKDPRTRIAVFTVAAFDEEKGGAPR